MLGKVQLPMEPSVWDMNQQKKTKWRWIPNLKEPLVHEEGILQYVPTLEPSMAILSNREQQFLIVVSKSHSSALNPKRCFRELNFLLMYLIKNLKILSSNTWKTLCN